MKHVYCAVEPEDEGLYECVVRNGDLERVHSTYFTVERPTRERLSALTVGVDHANACFHVQFDVPDEVGTLADASLSTYILAYYKAPSVADTNEEDEGTESMLVN